MRRREESENGVLRQIAGSKMFGKIILKPLQFRKDSSSPRMTERIQIFIVPLRMHFYRSKSTLDSLKSDFNVFTWEETVVGCP